MLPDYLKEDLDIVFVGTSVATASASRGHYYSGPGNKFWEFLWEAALTGERLLVPEQDANVLDYGIGLTDVVKRRASSSDSFLRSSDYDVPGFIAKIEAFKPFVVAFNGKQAARKVFTALREGEPQLGVAPFVIGDSRAYVLPSSSGSSADPAHYAPKGSKAEWWREFGMWLQRARGKE